MPYHVEKGPTLTLIEKHLNTVGNKVDILGRMRAQDDANSGTTNWLSTAMPSLWQDQTLLARAPSTLTNIEKAWFGVGAPTGATWVGYSGDVNRIVRRGLRWALEVSLNLKPYDPLPSVTSAPAGAPIELFWICGIHWFETWVIQRPGPGGRIVTVIFLTPAHEGAVVSTTPLATAATTRAGGGYPVPSLEPDYLRVAFPPTDTAAAGRSHASWVVTHAQHTPYELLKNNAMGTRLGPQQAPALAYYVGSGGPVVVSPSVPAGGVPRTGMLP